MVINKRKYIQKFAPEALRKFADSIELNLEMFDWWLNEQMKTVTNNGGMPKPNGRV